MSWSHRVGRMIAAIALLVGAATAQAGPYSGLYVFGDSLSDVGNDFLLTGGRVPAPAFYTDGSEVGRFTNGLNYADHLAAGLGLGLAASAVAGGTDYAYGAARIDKVGAGLPPTALNFAQQVGRYLAGGAADPSALYVLWIGANDMSDLIDAAVQAIAAGNGAAVPALIGTRVGAVLNSIAGAVGGLASIGAQHFLIPNLPDLSLTPAVRAVGNAAFSALVEGTSEAFNQSLAGVLGANTFAVLDIRSLDVFAAQTEITLDPAAFGFSNVSEACYTGNVQGNGSPGVCNDPDQYMYWDSEHPSAALHARLGQLALEAALPEPGSGGLLLVGLMVVAGLRRRAMLSEFLTIS